ncbi:MAG: OmpA family protein, partial [Alphaproteobacteria bacterium]
VEGHTDNIPIRAGRFTDNWDLSTERALSVVRFLAAQGVPANRLAAAGYGEFQPLDAADTDDARRKNRRIEMKITQRITARQ